MDGKSHLRKIIERAGELLWLDPANAELRRLAAGIINEAEAASKAPAISSEERAEVIMAARVALSGSLVGAIVPDADPATDDLVEVVWRDANIDGPEQRMRLSAGKVRKATFDGGTEGRTAAAHLVSEIEAGNARGNIYPVDEQALVTIVSPGEWAGSFSVSRSVTQRKGKEVRGYLAYEVDLSPMEPEHRAAHLDALRRTTPSDQVFDTFKILSNPYGDMVGFLGPDDAELADLAEDADRIEGQLADLVRLYDNGTLHDRGRIVLDRLTDGIGVNLERHLDPDEDYPLHKALEDFHGKTGYRAQPCDWKVGTGFVAKAVVVFVPYERIADAAEVHDLLWDMEVPKVAPPSP